MVRRVASTVIKCDGMYPGGHGLLIGNIFCLNVQDLLLLWEEIDNYIILDCAYVAPVIFQCGLICTVLLSICK